MHWLILVITTHAGSFKLLTLGELKHVGHEKYTELGIFKTRRLTAVYSELNKKRELFVSVVLLGSDFVETNLHAERSGRSHRT